MGIYIYTYILLLFFVRRTIFRILVHEVVRAIGEKEEAAFVGAMQYKSKTKPTMEIMEVLYYYYTNNNKTRK